MIQGVEEIIRNGTGDRINCADGNGDNNGDGNGGGSGGMPLSASMTVWHCALLAMVYCVFD